MFTVIDRNIIVCVFERMGHLLLIRRYLFRTNSDYELWNLDLAFLMLVFIKRFLYKTNFKVLSKYSVGIVEKQLEYFEYQID